jgi:hypothetical protein
MKKNFLRGLTAVAAAAMVFVGCQKEQISTNPALNAVVGASETCCITAYPSPTKTLFTETVIWGGSGQNNNKVTITAYNDDQKTYVSVTNISNTTAGMTIRYANPGLVATQTVGVTVYNANTPGTHSFTIDHDEDWACGDEITFSFYISGLGGGNSIQTGILTYELKATCGGCDDEFELVSSSACGTNGARSAQFKFTAGEAGAVFIQGGLTNGATGVTSTVKVNGVSAGVLSPKAGTPVWNWTSGNLSECDVVEIRIDWTASNEEIIDSWSVERATVEVGRTDAVDCD